MRYLLFFLLLLSSLQSFSQAERSRKSFLVCGDHFVHLVDYQNSKDTIPKITWTWDARQAEDLPEEFRLRKFNSVDDCKAIKGGKELVVSSSGGAVAVVELKTSKVLFYAAVPNAHSVEVLPGNLLVAAASTSRAGNKLMVFDLDDPQKILFTDSLYSAHGVVWIEKRNSLFALGYDVLREYKLKKGGALVLEKDWKIPGIGGHDLQLSPDGKSLFITEHDGSWRFDLKTHGFSKIEGFPDTANIKSLGRNASGQFIFTVPEQSWWTYHVSFYNPDRQFAFPSMKVYKARWFND